jgi:hypothetical protein
MNEDEDEFFAPGSSANDGHLRTLLGGLVQMAEAHGTESQEVQTYVREHREVPEFLGLAATLIVLLLIREES